MKYLILFTTMLFAAEMEVDGDLKVTGTIQSQTIDSLMQAIAELQAQLTILQMQMDNLHNDNDCNEVYPGTQFLDVCGICGGSNTDLDNCPINYALSFDGFDDYVQLPNIEYYSDFTISGIFSSYNSSGRIFDQDGGNGEDLIHVNINSDGNLFVTIRNELSGTELQSINIVNDGQFHSFTFIRYNNSLYLYINGNLEDQRTMVSFIFNNSIPTCFGCTLYDSEPQSYFSGIIDKIKIINSATFPEDSDYYLSNEIGYDTIGLWNFNQGSGSILHDNSGNGIHGIIDGAQWIFTDD